MEAVPRLPMISFDLKVSPENAEFGPKLKPYIQDFYNEDPDSYTHEIHQLESLRGAAVRPTRDVAGCSILKRYYCQLHFLQSRFPMSKDGAAAVTFSWKVSNNSVVYSFADIHFEMTAILYNIGALHTQLGSDDPRDSPDGMKMACTHFQIAAWAFQQLKDPYPQPCALDFSPELMEFSYRICLAQAQECILEKSMIDNRKPIIIAKVASAVVKYYHVASSILHHTYSEDLAVSETVGGKLLKVWKRYAKFKRMYYTSVCLLFLGQQSEEQQKMGERVAYYNTAYEMLEQAMKIAKNFDKSEINIAAVGESLTFTMDVVEGKRKAARNENEFIYHEAVPDRDQLEKVAGVSLVKGIDFSVNDREVSGPDIFARLVPMKAHTVSSLYSEEKAKLLREVGGKIEKADQELVEFMLNLQLDYLYCHKSQDLPFPEEIIERCAAMTVKTSEVEKLEIELNKLSQIYHDVTKMLEEIDSALQVEEQREKEYQLAMGPRPPSIVATDMTREAKKYQEANEKATQSTEKLNVAVQGYIANLRLLSSGLDELAKVLPSPPPITDPGEEAVIQRMQQLKEKVDEMRQQRIMLANQLRESIFQDDITRQLVTRQAENYEAIFSEELKKHQQYVSFIEQNLGAQEKILSAVTEAYANYSAIQRKYSKAIQKRSAAIKNLIMSFDSLDEISSKIEKGMKFYSALEANVSKLLSRIRSTCKVQQEERDQILAKNKIALPSKTATNPRLLSQDTPQAPKLKDYLDNMKKDSSGQSVMPVQMPTYQTANQPNPAYYANYNAALPTSTHDPLSNVTSNVANLNLGAKSHWIPGVRPAPVGSESTNPAEGPTATSQPPVPAQQNATSGYSYYGGPGATGYSNYPSASYGQVPTQQHYGSYGYGAQWNYSNWSTQGSGSRLDVSGIDFPSELSVTGGAGPEYSNAPEQPQNMQPGSVFPTSDAYRYGGGGSVSVSATSSAPTVTMSNSSDYSSSTGAVQAPKAYGLPSTDTTGISEQVAAALAYKHSLGAGVANGYNDAYKYNLPSSAGYTLPSQAGYMPPTSLFGQSGAAAAAASLYNPSAGGVSANYSQALAEASKYIQSSVGSGTFPAAVAAHAGRMSAPTLPSGFSDFSRMSNYMPPTTNPTVLSALSNYSNNAGSALGNFGNSPAAAAIANFKNLQSTLPNVGQSGFQFNPSAYTGQGHTTTPSFLSSLSCAQTLAGQQPPSSLYANPSTVPFGLGSLASSNPGSVLPNSMQYPYLNNPASSYYSHAGNFLTNQTASAAAHAYAVNPANPANPTTNPANPTNVTNTTNPTNPANPTNTDPNSQSAAPNSASAQAQGYYQSQYGLQFSNPATGGNSSGMNATDCTTSSDNSRFSASAQNTYMQARMPNSNPSTTYSINQGGPLSSSTTTPTGGTPSDGLSPSNMDLLAGLDFTVNKDQLLVPQDSWSESASAVKSSGAQTAEQSGCTTTSAPSQVVNQTSSATSRRPPTSMALVAAEQMRMLQIPIEGDQPALTKPAAKDPFQDNEALNQFTQEVEKYEKFVEGLTTKTLNGPTPLDLKWKELLELQEKDVHKRNISVARCYPMKNRFPDILPYDCSRVELPSTKDDYINASYMKDLTPLTPSFILTQAPLPSTYTDFWTMVWEKQVEVIVCLLSDAELNGQLYWPSEKGQEMPMGRMKLSLQTSIARQHWVERIISVCESETRATKVVIHLQFIAWPGSSFPASPGPFLSFVFECLTFHSQQRSVHHPITVHCLSGVGRTGLFCLLAAAICEIHAGHGLIDLVKLSASMSERRKGALRDREHLKFAYQSLLYYAQDLLLKRGILTSGSSFEDKRNRSGGKCHTRHPSEDFLLGPPTGLSQLQSGIEKMGLDLANRGEPTMALTFVGEAAPATTSSALLDVVSVSPDISPPVSSAPIGTPLSGSCSPSGRASPSFQLASSHLTDLSQLGQQVRAKEKKPLRFTAESFKNNTASIENLQPNADDPFSQLDPLWPLKRS